MIRFQTSYSGIAWDGPGVGHIYSGVMLTDMSVHMGTYARISLAKCDYCDISDHGC